ncbi:unnamed protein product, partial [Meganyctiphanes norvegica]
MAQLCHISPTLLDGHLYLYGSEVQHKSHLGWSTVQFSLRVQLKSIEIIVLNEAKYSMDCYMRQEWQDERLKFKGPEKRLTINIKMLENIWKPDTYFHNGHGSYVHMITRPNKFFRIDQEGNIYYSMRLTIKARCPMMLRNFPMDKQSCPLVIGSYAYTEKDVRYQWSGGKVSFEKSLMLSQFDLIDFNTINHSMRWKHGKDVFSALQVNFNLQRHTGYFLIQVYVPCILIVILSWVSFWINREATSDRVGLGITTVLTLSTISLDTRTDLPKVHYATALDWFILMSFGYCIATLLQFAAVSYFTKLLHQVCCCQLLHQGNYFTKFAAVSYSTKLLHQGSLLQSATSPSLLQSATSPRKEATSPSLLQSATSPRKSAAVSYFTELAAGAGIMNQGGVSGSSLDSFRSAGTQTEKHENCFSQFYHCILGDEQYRRNRQRAAKRQHSVNSVSIIDTVARYLFPASYGLLNLWYWYSYYDTDVVIMYSDPGY